MGPPPCTVGRQNTRRMSEGNMPTVWAIYSDYGYEGYGEPIAVYSTEAAAIAAAEARWGKNRRSDWEMIEVELDPPLTAGKRGSDGPA